MRDKSFINVTGSIMLPASFFYLMKTCGQMCLCWYTPVLLTLLRGQLSVTLVISFGFWTQWPSLSLLRLGLFMGTGFAVFVRLFLLLLSVFCPHTVTQLNVFREASCQLANKVWFIRRKCAKKKNHRTNLQSDWEHAIKTSYDPFKRQGVNKGCYEM